ncbi:MAG: flagellar basal body protein [Caulobacteraceae bacterium]|nr:flagellar basal body protein [Caulobacteraceae bacterium]
MALSATDAADRVEQLITLTQTLNGRLSVEAAAFEQRRVLDVASELDETAKLANLYRHECARVKMNPDLIRAAPRDARLRLADATRAFEAVMERHAVGLQAARTLTEGLVKAVAQEVAAQRAPGVGYAAGGAAVASDATAVTLNRKA